MDQQTRRALMKAVSYGYFKLPIKEGGHGVLTIAVAQKNGQAHYGASICAPSDMFCRMHGKFGTGARDYDSELKRWVRVPGAHDRLADHLRGVTGLLQGSCDPGDSSFENTQKAAATVVADLQALAASRKLAWLRDVDFDAVGPMTKPRKRA